MNVLTQTAFGLGLFALGALGMPESRCVGIAPECESVSPEESANAMEKDVLGCASGFVLAEVQEKPIAGIDIRGQDEFRAKKRAEEKKAKEDKAKKEQVKKPGAKKAGEKAKAKKVEAPPGYEDAPTADEVPKANVAEGAGMAIAAPAIVVPKKRREGKPDPNVDILKQKVDKNVLALEKRYLAQFQMVAKVERSFLLRACNLDKKQQIKIVKSSDRAARVAARKFALRQNMQMRGRMGGGGAFFDTGSSAKNPAEQMRSELYLSIKDMLSKDQLKQYQLEIKSREDYLKRVTVTNLVVVLDKRLVLTGEQRKQLTESLSKNWDPSWEGALQYMMSSTLYLPNIPDRHLVKYLNDRQKRLLKGIQRVSFSSSNIGNLQQGMIIEDTFAGEDDAVEEHAHAHGDHGHNHEVAAEAAEEDDAKKPKAAAVKSE